MSRRPIPYPKRMVLPHVRRSLLASLLTVALLCLPAAAAPSDIKVGGAHQLPAASGLAAALNGMAPLPGLPEEVDADRWGSIQDYIERDLRTIQPASDEGVAYRAENAASGLVFAFSPLGGFSAHPWAPMPQLDRRVTGEETTAVAAPTWEWGLRPIAVGVGERLAALGRPLSQWTQADTLTNAYAVPWLLAGELPGGLVEWIANGSRGLRQNFTLAARPHGPPDAPLVLQLAQAGNLSAIPATDGSRLTLVATNGQVVLTYTGLHVFDATGRSLPAHFELDTKPRAALTIEVRDAGAVYPLVIDPLLGTTANPAWSAVGENADDWFSWSVAGAGDVNGDGYADLAVSAYYYGNMTGKVYVYYGSAAGLSLSPDWIAEGENEGDIFGYSVAGAGDVNGDGYAELAVGARAYGNDRGKVYVFHGSTNGLSAGSEWDAVGENERDDFGYSVAGAGDVNGDGYADLAVAANNYSHDRGKVYVFLGSASDLTSSAAWSAVGENAFDYFGGSFVGGTRDVNGDGYADLAVAATNYSHYRGKVYVFYGSAAGLSLSPDWIAVGENELDVFGWSVAEAGDLNGDGYADLAVAATGYSHNRGKVYVYYGSATGLSLSPDWIAEGENEPDTFGYSAAGAGDVNGDGYADLAVSAVQYGSNTGKVYVLFGSATGLSASRTWSAVGENVEDNFGWSVAGAGDVNGDGYADLAVGSVYYSTQRGKVYVFHGGASGVSGTAGAPAWSAVGEHTVDSIDHFGYSVASAGDVNGDGYGDIVVGTPDVNDYAGKVYVFHGGVGGLTGTAGSPAWSAEGDGQFSHFGRPVASAGDVNGDGYGDIIVGAPFANDMAGKVYVFYGGIGGLTGTAGSPAWSAQGEGPNNDFGTAAAGAGDVNGDGCGDIIVGAPGANDDAGKVYVFYGGAGGVAGMVGSAAWSTVGEAAADAFGGAVAGAGDVNGDGYGDIVIGARGYNSSVGKVYVFHGGESGVNGNAASPAWSTVGTPAGSALGRSVSGAGDVNGDGYADIVVGATLFNAAGKVYVFHGSATGVTGSTAAPSWQADDDSATGAFGGSVASAGDVNGDGYGDVVVGAQSANSFTGKAYVFYGGVNGLTGTAAEPAWFAEGENTGDWFGHSVASAGDVNGDGYSDIVVGASAANNMAGKVYVFHGGASGRLVLAQQLRSDGSTAIQPSGLTDSEGSVQLQMHGVSPWGRERVKLQVQACPAGAPYGAVSCIDRTSAVWTDVMATSSGVTLEMRVDGLTHRTLYHWRARVLYAPLQVTAAGITAPPHPAHGPWRLLNAQAALDNVRSIFAPRMLRVTTTGNGTITSRPAGIDCGAACSAAIEYGTQVSLIVAAGAGYAFSRWGGACSGTGICQVTMDAAREVSALFTAPDGEDPGDEPPATPRLFLPFAASLSLAQRR